MCGICGIYSTSLSLDERDLFKKLLLLNVFRGEHATGVIKAKTNPKIVYSFSKAAIPSPEFVFSKHGQDFIGESATVNTLIGHARYATKGSQTKENAHPFNFQNVIGVHNGTIPLSFKHSDEYETDSEALYRNINDYGLEAALNEIGDSNPAYSLVFIDKAEGTLNFIRNSKRPMVFTYLAGRTTLLWSSDRRHIEFAIDNTKSVVNQQGWEAKDTKEKYFILHEHDLLSIKIGHSASTAKIKHLNITERVWSSGYSVVGGNTYTGPWIKGSDGEYRTRAAEYARLEELAKKWETAYDADDERFGKVAEVKPSTELVVLSQDRPPEVGGKYGNFRNNHKDLSSLPWLERQQQLATQQHAKVTEGKKTVAAGEGGGKSSGAAKAVTPGYGTKPVSLAERDFRLSCGCFVCGEKTAPEKADTVHWWSREWYACDYCYNNSDGDWVRRTVDDLWEDAPMIEGASKTIN